VQDVDPDNLLLTVTGEGSKQRKLPFSFELREALFRHTREFCPTALHAATRHLAGAIRRWLIVNRIARHFFASRSPDVSGFFLKRLSRLCVMFWLGLRSVTKAWLVYG
jgi:hypothetical protein